MRFQWNFYSLISASRQILNNCCMNQRSWKLYSNLFSYTTKNIISGNNNYLHAFRLYLMIKLLFFNSRLKKRSFCDIKMIEWNFFPVWYSFDLNIQPDFVYEIPNGKKMLCVYCKKNLLKKSFEFQNSPKENSYNFLTLLYLIHGKLFGAYETFRFCVVYNYSFMYYHQRVWLYSSGRWSKAAQWSFVFHRDKKDTHNNFVQQNKQLNFVWVLMMHTAA